MTGWGSDRMPLGRAGAVLEFSLVRKDTAARAGCYLLASPSYFGGHLAIGWGSDSSQANGPSLELLAERMAGSRLNLRYYSPEIHKAAFVLPPYIAALANRS